SRASSSSRAISRWLRPEFSPISTNGATSSSRRRSESTDDTCQVDHGRDGRTEPGCDGRVQRGLTMANIRQAALARDLIAGRATGPHLGSAQVDDYPTRPVTLVVPFAPGGSTSIIARILADKLEQRLGKPFVVENRPGSGGMIAVSQVAHGPADG